MRIIFDHEKGYGSEIICGRAREIKGQNERKSPPKANNEKKKIKKKNSKIKFLKLRI